MRKNRSRQRLVDCAIERLVQRLLAALAQILTNAIEDDDRVVQRVTDNGKNCSDDGERDLEVHKLEERKRRENVVARCDQRRQRKTPLEANCEVHGRYKEREKHRDDCITCELVTDSWTDSLGAHQAILIRAKLLRQNVLNAVFGRLSTGRRGALLFRLLRANGELAIVSELLDLGAVNASVIEMRAQLADVNGLGEGDLHHRSTGELDALVDSLEGESAESDCDEDGS